MRTLIRTQRLAQAVVQDLAILYLFGDICSFADIVL